ncbi:DUF397 domain-containing protein [Streptomyces iconiensis]|uniref:DUF397 domain-containing protein n=1 Tax=Streptomyces iconiensis TaxID=1384038 RepID=A0ABT7A7X3_9ACTN|nr:DUF397 domain-containing protein [Streptomyces iconiensis]MDJ1137430.1 DUF397 domain-containing protein [Streptomyces iconiensis]
MSNTPWQKSSFSGDASNCVNVASGGDTVLLRESDEPGVVLRVSAERFRMLLASVKADGFTPGVAE